MRHVILAATAAFLSVAGAKDYIGSVRRESESRYTDRVETTYFDGEKTVETRYKPWLHVVTDTNGVQHVYDQTCFTDGEYSREARYYLEGELVAVLSSTQRVYRAAHEIACEVATNRTLVIVTYTNEVGGTTQRRFPRSREDLLTPEIPTLAAVSNETLQAKSAKAEQKIGEAEKRSREIKDRLKEKARKNGLAKDGNLHMKSGTVAGREVSRKLSKDGSEMVFTYENGTSITMKVRRIRSGTIKTPPPYDASVVGKEENLVEAAQTSKVNQGGKSGKAD